MEIQKKSAFDKVSDFIKPYLGSLFPGCIIGCANSTKNFIESFGTQDGVSLVKKTDFFDIASLTKAILNTLVLKKIQLKDLDQKVVEFLPLEGKYRDQITVKHLLTFGVEYGDMTPLSKIQSKEELLRILQSGDLVLPPGTSYRYTNISSMILSMFLEKKFGKQFDILLKEDLLEPLNMVATTFSPSTIVNDVRNIVPTEIEEVLKRGVVQDESARLFGNPVGSAGLFSKMEDLIFFGQSFLGESTYLPKEVIRIMPLSQFSNAAMSFGLGMGLRHQNECDLCNDDGSPIVVLKKNGFSGVHFSVFPENNFCFVIFGNICYPKRPNAEARDRFTLFHKKMLRLLYENRYELLNL